MSKPIPEQLDEIEKLMRSHRMFIETTLANTLTHVKIDNGHTPRDIAMQIMNDMMEVIRLSTITIVLEMLTHPQRFEMFAGLAGRLEERPNEEG